MSGARIVSLDAHRARSVGRPRCGRPTLAGAPCRNLAGPSGACRLHAPAAAHPTRTDTGGGRVRPLEVAREWSAADEGGGRSAEAAEVEALWPEEVEELLRAVVGFVRRRLTGAYDVDVFGFDRELTETVLLPLARPLYRSYWRVRTVGIEHVPGDRASLVVANHAGVLPFDAIMTKLALLDEHPAHLHLRELAADLALRLPFVGQLARKTGDTLAHDDDAVRLLRAGETVGVWPEGFKGIGKRYRDRYKLQRFGRGGFVSVALRTGAPIVPVAIVGSEEIYPMIGDVKVLARLFGFPYFPVTWQFPWLGPLGLLPLPSRWVIEFGAPIETSDYGPEAADDPMLVLELTDRVRDTIQQMLYRTLLERRSAFT